MDKERFIRVSSLGRRFAGCAAAVAALLGIACQPGDSWVSHRVGPADSDHPPSADGGSRAAAQPALSVQTVQPDHGPFIGGTEVVVSGDGFDDQTRVAVGGRAVDWTKIVLNSARSMVVLAPPGDVGPADVVVTRGKESVGLEAGFTYDPIVVDPGSGPTAGATFVTIKGKGTAFDEGTKLSLAGQPLIDVEVITPELIEARTPPGAEGKADLVYSDGAVEQRIRAAFEYYASTNPAYGGLGGGPVQGTVTVSVLDAASLSGIQGASVVLQRGSTVIGERVADKQGVVVFSEKELVGPLTVSAGLEGYQTTSIVGLDSRDITVLLSPLKIEQGEPGPSPMTGTIGGLVSFGGTTGAGTPAWSLVPDPGPGQVQQVQIFLTAESMEFGRGDPRAVIVREDDSSTAWPYEITSVRPGTYAVYALAGLLNEFSGQFTPHALGLARGLVVGAGEQITADLLVAMPMSETVSVELVNPPPELQQAHLLLALNLGADGFALLTDVIGPATPGQPIVIEHLPSFALKELVDATFALNVMLGSSDPGQTARAGALEIAARPDQGAIVVDHFVGVPVQDRPREGALLFASGGVFAWHQEGGLPHNLGVTLVTSVYAVMGQPPNWVIISAGSSRSVALPDPAMHGLAPLPDGGFRVTRYLAHLPGFAFDSFNYLHLDKSYWDRWSAERTTVLVLK